MEHITTEKDTANNTDEKKETTERKYTETIIPRVAKFEKVSFETFMEAFLPIFIQTKKAELNIPAGESFGYDRQELEDKARYTYDNIKLPTRSTAGSAGYDFYYPFGDTKLVPGAGITIPTGIKAYIIPGWVLKEYPRSSLGFKYRLQFDDTVSIIDSDYYDNPENEGHIFVKLTNDSKTGRECIISTNMRMCQGIFVPYGITIDDEVDGVRTGGFGSTGA